MPFTKLSQEKIDKIRERRTAGLAIEAIAAELGLSSGAVSKYSRDISKPEKVGIKLLPKPKKPSGASGSDLIPGKMPISDVLAVIKDDGFSDDTKEHANAVVDKRLELSELKVKKDMLKTENEITEEKLKQQPGPKMFSVSRDGTVHTDFEGEYTFSEALRLSESYRLDAHKNNGESNRGDKDPEAKFTVTADGAILVAEGSALTRVEAEAAASQIRTQKKEEAAGTVKDEGKLTFDENGHVVVAPGAKLSMQEAVLYSVIQKSRQQGDSRSDLQIIQDKLAEQETLDELRGRKKGGDSTSSDMNDKMYNLMQDNLKLQREQSNAVMADAIKGMTMMLEKINTPKEESLEVKAIREQNAIIQAQNKALMDKLDAEREERHKNELKQRDDELAKVKDQVVALANKPAAGTKEVTDLISEGFAGLKEIVASAGSQIGPALAKRLNGPEKPLTEGQQHIIDVSTRGLKAMAKEAAKTTTAIPPDAAALASELFGKKG